MDRNEEQKKLADELVAGRREKVYGHPKDNYRRIAKIWSAVLGIEVTPTQAVLCELGVKLSRLIQSPDDEDTQVDVHGYIKVLQRLLDPNDQPGYKVKVKYYRPEPPEPFTITYSDGSKDMSFEEACGIKAPSLPSLEDVYMTDSKGQVRK